MVKFIIANFNKFFLFFIFFVNISYAYVIEIESLSNNRDYSIKGHLDRGHISRGVSKAEPGMTIYYAPPGTSYYAKYTVNGIFCKTDYANEALKIINGVLANKRTLYLTDSYRGFPFPDLDLIITCPIEDYKSWNFQGYAGSPKRVGSASCQITTPLDVDFGIVAVGDDNKVIERQVAIKCDKATGIWLTLEGDNKSDTRDLDGADIKLRVGEDTNRKYYNVEENRVTMANLTFTAYNIRNRPGIKESYVLLISEIP